MNGMNNIKFVNLFRAQRLLFFPVT